MAKVVLKLGDNVSTDTIYPGRFQSTILPTETPQHAFADLVEFNTQLNAGHITPGSVIIAGKNFGCGSSREQAVSCLKAANLVVVAKHFARIFSQNAINLGLSLVTCPEIEAEVNDEVEFAGTRLINRTEKMSFDIVPLTRAQQSIIDAGGLIAYTRQRIMRDQM